MGFIISFFRSRQLERIDYADLILYFEKELNCHISYSEEDVKITYHDDVFDFDYYFYLTKRSKVNNLALLNPEFVNIRFFIDFPEIIPEQASRQIILLLDKVCKNFQFMVYYDGLTDVSPLNVVELMKHLSEIKNALILNQDSGNLYYLDSYQITHIANYHQSLKFLKEDLGDDIVLNKYQMLTTKENQNVVLAYLWDAEMPTVFPPHLNYIIVREHGVEQFLNAEIFFKKTKRFMQELKDYIPNVSLLLLNKKYASKVKRIVKRLSKYFEHELVFTSVSITNIIEK